MLRIAPDAGSLTAALVIYRAPADGVLRQVRLDAMTAIFDRRSGQTHLVADVVPAILQALGAGAADFKTLCDRLFDDESHATDEMPTALADRLAELAAIGLIEAA